MAWATIEDLETVMPSVAEMPESRVQFVLDSVDGFIKWELDESGVGYSDPQGPFLTNLRSVTTWVSCRVLDTNMSMLGVTQFSQTAGPITQSTSYDMGMGNLYLTGVERAMLGISAQGRAQQLFYSEDILGGGGDA